MNSRVTWAGGAPEFRELAAADPRYAHYSSLLKSWPGLVSGPPEPLIEDSLVVLPHLQSRLAMTGRGQKIVDVGTGGGMPGIPLALALPGLRLTLVEADRRKAGFLSHAAAQLQLPVEVVAERAETAARESHRESFDVAVCRALAAPPVVLELTLPFLKIGGRLLAMRTGDEEDDPDRLASVASLLGGGSPISHPAPTAARRRGTVLAVTKESPTPDGYPRRPGVPNRRPLGR